MDEGKLQVRDHDGEGYKPLVDFGSWRVAILRPEKTVVPEPRRSMERHLETDEVFILTKGQGTLIVGGNGPEPGDFAAQKMDIGKIYNVRQGVWHTVELGRDASVVIVENRDTVRENSEYAVLSTDQNRTIMAAIQGTLSERP